MLEIRMKGGVPDRLLPYEDVMQHAKCAGVCSTPALVSFCFSIVEA